MSEKHPKQKRDKWADREADKDREPGDAEHPEPPSGSVGPSGSVFGADIGKDAMEEDPPEDRG